jgi:predicted transcriptional regulator
MPRQDKLRTSSIRPSERELEVLGVLWERGPSTVREVLTALGDAHSAGYTSLQKIMTIMLDKNLVRRSAEGRVHRYSAAVRSSEVRRSMAGELLDRAFGGSVAALVQSALAARPASRAELEAVEALLADAAPAGHGSKNQPESAAEGEGES